MTTRVGGSIRAKCMEYTVGPALRIWLRRAMERVDLVAGHVILSQVQLKITRPFAQSLMKEIPGQKQQLSTFRPPVAGSHNPFARLAYTDISQE